MKTFLDTIKNMKTGNSGKKLQQSVNTDFLWEYKLLTILLFSLLYISIFIG